jgi:hypothetical protein
MVPLTQLWLPILLSAVVVFVASSLIHMALGYHRSDFRKVPGEEKLLETLRAIGLPPGTYHFPHCEGPKEARSPEHVEKMKTGPLGILTIMPSGVPSMGKYLALWFLYSVVVSFFVAYLAGRTLDSNAPYLSVFRVAGTAAFLAYAMAHTHNAIWKGESWGTTIKFYFDGLVYGLLTAGVFGWLWPRG